MAYGLHKDIMRFTISMKVWLVKLAYNKTLENIHEKTHTNFSILRYVWGGMLKYLHILIISWLSTNVIANECHQNFSEKELLASVNSGNSVSYPFQLSRLVEGENEPELKLEYLEFQSQHRIVQVSKDIHSSAKRRSAERIMKKPSETDIEIIYRGPNSGFYTSTYYKQVNGCWLMSGLSNEST